MKLLLVFVRLELRLRLRSAGFWLIAGSYVVLSMAPVVALEIARHFQTGWVNASAYAGRVHLALPFLTFLLASGLSVDAIQRERDEGSFVVLGLAPLSNAGYVLRRLTAVLTVIVPLTLVPVLGAAALAAAGGLAPADPWQFLGPLILHVLPLAVLTSALALGLGTVARGVVPAAILGFLVFMLALSLGNDLLARTGRRLDGPASWLGIEQLTYAVDLSRNSRWVTTPTSDAPFDVAAAAEIFASQALGFAAFAVAVIGAAVVLVGRTRADIRPWRIRDDHPLKGSLRLLSRLRELFVPEPGLVWRDRLVGAVGVLVLAGSSWLYLDRNDRYRSLADERHRVETSGLPEPTSDFVVPTVWRIEGHVTSRGDVSTVTTASFENRGPDPVAHLAFSLDPGLSRFAVRPARGEVTSEVTWDRVALRLEPPLAPGEELELEFELAGTPSFRHFNGFGIDSFDENYERLSGARFSHELVDLSRSWTERDASRRRVDLAASSLTLVPRYTTWRVVEGEEVFEQQGRFIPPEATLPLCELDVNLDLPEGWLLADSCGHVSTAEPGGSALRGSCTTSVARYRAAGGKLARVEAPEEFVVVAALPQHRAAIGLHLPSFREAAKLATGIVPGLDPLRGCALVEWPPGFSLDPLEGMWRFWRWQYMGEAPTIRAEGRLVYLPEGAVIQNQPFPAQALAVSLTATRLLESRSVVPGEDKFFLELYRWFARSRLGVSRTGCVVEGAHQGRAVQQATKPLLAGDTNDWELWRSKLPAVMSYLELRIGSAALARGVRAFIDAGEEGPGTAEELTRAIASVAGEPLTEWFEDYVAGQELPLLTLAEVRMERSRIGWRVQGQVENHGSGRVVCPVVLSTETGEVATQVSLRGEGGASFSFDSTSRPRSVSLDPRGECFRYRRVPLAGMLENVDLTEGT